MYKVLFATLLGLFLLSGCAGTPSNSQAPSSAEGKEALKLAHLLRDNGRYKAAFKVYQKMDANGQLHGAYLLEYASVAALSAPAQKVLPLYQRAQQALSTRATPEQREALCLGLGRAYLQLAQRAKAEHNFQCVLSRAPNNVSALNGLSIIASYRGELTKARQLLETAIDIDANNNMLANNLAMVYLLQGNKEQAIALLKARQASLSLSGRLNLALLYILDERSDLARALLRESLNSSRTEQAITRFESLRQRVNQGHSLASELAALTQTPLQFQEDE